MSIRLTLATTGRILRQLRHDRRSMALVLVLPVALLTLIYFMWEGGRQFDRIALAMLGIFPLTIMFLLTSISVLRERTSGTLERLLTTPIGRLDLLFGYGIAFGLAAAVQASIAGGYALGVLGLAAAGGLGLVILIAFANAVLGVALGLLCSAFARTEFQAAQFMPLVILPQLLLCGLFVPREEMAGWLEALSVVMPMTYAVEALAEVGAHADPTSTMWRNLAVVAGVTVAALVLGALSLRRRTP